MMRESRRPFANHPHAIAAPRRGGACQSLLVEDTFAAPPNGLDTTCGELVNIYERNTGGRIVFAGLARRGPPTGRRPLEHWVVFVGECRLRRRLVLPGPYQSDPEGVIAGLLALYADVPDSPDTFLSDVIGDAANDNHPASEEEA